MSEPMGEAVDELLRKIAKLEETNGALCAEINRQERVIEQLREKEAAYIDANHEQGMQLIEQGKRIRELESLVRDMWEDNIELCELDHCETNGKLERRMAELGLEVES